MGSFMHFFCALQANWREGGGDLPTAGDLCWESPATSEPSSFCFIHTDVLFWEEVEVKLIVRLTFWQETEIDGIHQLVVGATENVKEGNEDIREVTPLIRSTCGLETVCYVFPLTLFCSPRQSKTTRASGYGSCSSWSCALSLFFSWTGTTANTTSQHGLYLTGNRPGLAHIGYLRERWDWMYSLPCWSCCTKSVKILCSSGLWSSSFPWC